MKHTIIFLILAIILLPILMGCCCGEKWCRVNNVETLNKPIIKDAIAVLNPTQVNTPNGIVRFKHVCASVLITGHVTGLKPNSKHAMHIHEFGDFSDMNAKSAGGHYNPEGFPHALHSPFVFKFEISVLYRFRSIKIPPQCAQYVDDFLRSLTLPRYTCFKCFVATW